MIIIHFYFSSIASMVAKVPITTTYEKFMKTTLLATLLLAISSTQSRAYVQICKEEAIAMAKVLSMADFASDAAESDIIEEGTDEFSHFMIHVSSLTKYKNNEGKLAPRKMTYELVLDKDSDLRCSVQSVQLK